jgi:hypothetical protein
MEARSEIPVSLPHSKPTTSYWQDPPDAQVADYGAAAMLPGGVVDTVVIGSGITGAGVAWGLLSGGDEDSDNGICNGYNKGRVVLLEARQACSGATGRNGSPPSCFLHSRDGWKLGFEIKRRRKLGAEVKC